MIIHNDFVCFNYFNNQFHHFASWALWYAARFVSVITLKVLILRDEIGFLFIRNFHIFKVLRPIYLLLCSLLTTFWILSIQIVGFYLQFSLDSFFLTALYVNAPLVTLLSCELHKSRLKGMRHQQHSLLIERSSI